MAQSRPRRQTFSLTDIVGMNTVDAAFALPPGQVRDLENVDFFEGGLGTRRTGFVSVVAPGVGPATNPNAVTTQMYRHVPGGNPVNAELWAAAGGLLYRFAGGAWSAPAIPDGGTVGTVVSFATFNSKLFIAYNSSINRLHVWDGTSIRRVGLAPPAAAPGLASAGAGALAFTRVYRVRFVANNGPRISEPSPSASITIAASSGVNVTRPALVDGDESAWIVEAAASPSGPFFDISNVIGIGTLVFLDANAAINTAVPSVELGTYQLPPSCKYLSVYRQQILMAGAWETAAIAGQSVPSAFRVWFTRPLHTFDISDDESVPTTAAFKFWIDVSEDGDNITGLSYPLEGVPFAMKRSQMWGLQPTDDASIPFRPVRLTDAVGTEFYQSICIGEDEYGRPALYFESHRGPYRLGRDNLQFLGRDIQPLVQNLSVAMWVPDRREVWWSEGLGGANAHIVYKFAVRFGRPDRAEVRNGWTRAPLVASTNGSLTPVIASMVMFDENLTPTLTLRPMVAGLKVGTPNQSLIWQESAGVRQDDGINFAANLITGVIPFGKFLSNALIYPPRLYCATDLAQSATITMTSARNFLPIVLAQAIDPTNADLQTDTATFSLTAVPSITVENIATFEGISWSDGEVFQFQIGDGVAPLHQQWSLGMLLVPYEIAEEAE